MLDACRSSLASRGLVSPSVSESTGEGGYSNSLEFTSLSDLKPMPVFRTLNDDGTSLGNPLHDSAFGKKLAVKIYSVMLKLHITDGLFYESQRQVSSTIGVALEEWRGWTRVD